MTTETRVHDKLARPWQIQVPRNKTD